MSKEDNQSQSFIKKLFKIFSNNIGRFFVLSLTIAISFPLTSLAYPLYQANPDLVNVGPYDVAVSGASNWNSGAPYREFITIGQQYRIRQNGTISKIKIYTATKTSLTGFYIKIWRKTGTNSYDLVGTSNNLAADLVNGGYSTIDLSSPIVGVQEGDYYGYRTEGAASFYSRSSAVSTTYYITGIDPSSTGYNWETQSGASGYALPIELYMQAPQVAFIGDSIMAGHPTHCSFIETCATTNINSTIEKQLGNITGYTYQNMGIGSQTTSGILSRFNKDIISLKPKIIIIEGGVNDIAGGNAKSTFISNWTSMLDLAQSDAGVSTIVVLKILPWTNGTNVQMQTRDDWNTSLESLVAGYSKAIVVDASSYVGQFRTGGDPGNLWNIQTPYNQDGVHFNATGHAQISLAIKAALDLIKPEIISLSPSNGINMIAVDSNLEITFSNNIVPKQGDNNDIIIKKLSDGSVVETIDAQATNVTGGGTQIITIDPTLELEPNTIYYIQIGADAFDDTSGNSFAGIGNNTTWVFTTIDTENPIISTHSFIDDNINVNLSMVFNESVVSKQGDSNDIVIKKLSDSSVVKTIDAQATSVTGSGTETITISISDLDINTSYYAQIGADAFDDTSGNSFAGINDDTWVFTTPNIGNNYIYRKEIVISNLNIDTTLLNFPLYVKLNNDTDIGSAVRSDGYDIVFVSSDNKILPYERESWTGGDGVTANGNFWVKTNLNEDIDTNTNDKIYLYYGKSNSLDMQNNTGDVWSSNYAGVWHLDENVVDEQTLIGAHKDSTVNAKNGKQNENTTVIGKIDNGQYFDGINDKITIDSSYSSQDISASWWSNSAVPIPFAEAIFDIRRGVSDRMFAYHWNYGAQNGIYAVYHDTSTNIDYIRILDSSITQSDWHHFNVVWNETLKTFTLYKDGLAQSASGGGFPTIPSSSTTNFGAAAVNSEGNITLDEFRIYSSILSPSWIKFEFMNMSGLNNEINLGTQTYNDSTSPLSTIASPISGQYNVSQSVVLSSEGSDSIRYSTLEIPADCSSGTLYTEPINVSSSQTIYTRACDIAGNSSTASFVYVIDTVNPTATISYDVIAPTNGSVIATITPSEDVTVTNNEGLLTHTFTNNESFTFEFTDLAGNIGSATATVANIDLTVPAISAISFDGNSTISWTTDKITSSIVDYGLNTSYTTTTPETNTSPRVLNHSVAIQNLSSCTTYHYRIRVKDAVLNEGTSSDQTLVTDGCVTKHTSSGSSSVQTRVINLLAMGNTQAAEDLMKQFPSQFTNQNTNTVGVSPSLTRTLKIKTNGNDVKSLQAYLNTKGYNCGIADGNFGPKTKSAVIKFQIANNLKGDGIVGPITRGFLK